MQTNVLSITVQLCTYIFKIFLCIYCSNMSVNKGKYVLFKISSLTSIFFGHIKTYGCIFHICCSVFGICFLKFNINIDIILMISLIIIVFVFSKNRQIRAKINLFRITLQLHIYISIPDIPLYLLLLVHFYDNMGVKNGK